MRVQAFGLQRSGTNYLHWLFEHDFDAEATKRGGWKHGFPWERRVGLHGKKRLSRPIVDNLARRRIQPVIIRKDLDHWLESLERNPKDYDQGAGAVESDPVKAWERFYTEWAEHGPVFRYEDFLEDFPAAMTRLGELVGPPVSLVEPESVRYSPDWKPEDRSRYL